MRKHRLFPLLLLVACATSPAPVPVPPPAPAAWVQSTTELAALHERYRAAGLDRRRFTHQEFWDLAMPIIEASPHLHRERIGESVEGRPLFLVRYGSGPIPVLLWSQMHGDESTATMSLVDLLQFFASAPHDGRAQLTAERSTVWMIPMLNPDGAERFQRRNAQGIDINRDARSLATPEGRALRAVQQRLQPVFGFNLHDQSVRIPVQGTERIAAIALLAPPFDETRADNEVRLRAARLAAVMRHAAEPLVGGHIARYDDTYNPRAFGDGMQRWGTSTVLLESGAWRDDPEKQYLRRVNFVMLLSALDAIARGAYAAVDPVGYRGLPFNGSPVTDLVVRGGMMVGRDSPPFRADFAVNYADPLHRSDGRIVDVGDLASTSARDTLDVAGFYVHLEQSGAPSIGTAATIRPGQPATFTVRRAADPNSPVLWRVEAGQVLTATEPHE